MKPNQSDKAEHVVKRLTEWHSADERGKVALLRHVFFDSPYRACKRGARDSRMKR
jgi:hypothetical protein